MTVLDELLKTALHRAQVCGESSVRVVHLLLAAQERLEARGGGFLPDHAGVAFDGLFPSVPDEKRHRGLIVTPRLQRFLDAHRHEMPLEELVTVLMAKNDDTEGTHWLELAGVRGARVPAPEGGYVEVPNLREQPHEVTILDRATGEHRTIRRS